MTTRLTPEKVNDIIANCVEVINCKSITIRNLAKLIGKLVASKPAVQYAPLYYKSLEIEKDLVLRQNKGNFNAEASISDESKAGLQWWVDNIKSSSKPIIRPQPDIVIESDSSLTSWGAVNKSDFNMVSGLWSQDEKQYHINYLELKAAFLALQFFCHSLNNMHVQLYLDNTVAIKYLSKMSGRKYLLNCLAKEILLWCASRHIWLSVYHIPGVRNAVADSLSRKGNEDMEWMLTDNTFHSIQTLLGSCELDLFASKENHKLPLYVSYLPDPEAYAVNHFSLIWTNINAFVFLPFIVLGLVLQKILQDQATVTVVAPIFHTQPWFPTLLKLTCQQPYLLPKQCLILPSNRQKKHPLTKMRLGAFRVSGKRCLTEAFRDTLQTSYSTLGERAQRNSMGRIFSDGCVFVSEKSLIRLIPM